MSFDRTEYIRTLEVMRSRLDAKTAEMSQAIKKAAAPGAAEVDKQRADEISGEASRLHEELSRYLDDGLRRLGLSEEQIAALDAPPPPGERRLKLREMAPSGISPIGSIEDFLPQALEELLSVVPAKWLEEQAARHLHRLGKAYLKEPLSIISGSRVGRESGTLHRYARALLVARDFAERRVDYDFHAGSLLVPTIARLGSLQTALRTVRGDVRDRLRSLHEGVGEQIDSTVFELLVAGSCAEQGRDIEMVTPPRGKGKSPTCGFMTSPCLV